MISREDNLVKIGGVVLPGVLKKFEVTSAAALDEVKVEGLPVKPKQAVGYEDARVKIELTVDDTPGESLENRLSRLYALFRKKGQDIPQPVTIVSKKTAAAGIDQVIFENLSSVYSNKTNQESVTLELCEYIPIPITVSAGGAAGGGSAGGASTGLSPAYQDYLDSNRGSSPGSAADLRIKNTYDLSPAADNRMIGPQPLERIEDYRAAVG